MCDIPYSQNWPPCIDPCKKYITPYSDILLYESWVIAVCVEFLRTIALVFNTAQWFGIPTQGGKMAVCMSLVLLLMFVGLEVTAVWKLITAFGGWAVAKGSVTARLSGAIFYGNALFSQVLSWKFISSWKNISGAWKKSDIAMTVPLPQDNTIKMKMVVVITLVTAFATLEHALSMMAATGLNCPAAEYFKQYILTSHGFLLRSDEYSIWTAIPIFILSKLATILWNFQDLIIILISMGLTSRYRRLNMRLNNVVKLERSHECSKKKKLRANIHTHVQTWRRLREAYVRQAKLVRRVDDNLGVLILLSNLNNLYFICLQLFLGINNEQGPTVNRIYYMLSLSWLIVRACSVVLAAAEVHMQSRSALPILQACGANAEVIRLKKQLKHDFVAMTGMGLFTLDRKVLLQVAAAILKYELVLIQFDKHEIK